MSNSVSYHSSPVIGLKPLTSTMFLQNHHNDPEEGQLLLLLLHHFLLSTNYIIIRLTKFTRALASNSFNECCSFFETHEFRVSLSTFVISLLNYRLPSLSRPRLERRNSLKAHSRKFKIFSVILLYGYCRIVDCK